MPARARQSPGPTPTLAGRPWWVVLAAPGTVVIGIVAVLLAGAFTQAFAAPGTGLLDPGVVVRLGLPVATLVTELSMAVTVGSLALALFVLPWREPSDGVGFRRALVTAAVGAGLWAVAGLVQLVLEDANIAGMSLTDPAFGQQLGVFMTQVAYGRTLLEIVVLAAVTSTLLLLVRTPTGTAWTALLPVAALSLQAGTGHAAGTSSHELAISSLFLHLLGASVWIGGSRPSASSSGRGAGPTAAPPPAARVRPGRTARGPTWPSSSGGTRRRRSGASRSSPCPGSSTAGSAPGRSTGSRPATACCCSSSSSCSSCWASSGTRTARS
ncbi:hypothetical protein GCM10025864_19980 [Luteimicrobium album]|uniref:Copper resistance protein D domain-containing protein n=1 Tax=Luteimicrobium album TaxID=1054550 RepID=A0ABQ6I2S1_9MICO|nr:hypothetical protein GCM10025864_19980 [Luteimicrobium album]